MKIVQRETKYCADGYFYMLLLAGQLGWTLRPFFGTPTSPFTLFREREGNFYLSIIQSLAHLLGFG